ncbi:MAG: hypothetical protein ACM3XS_08960 [Bacteroidota bacterium]
MKRFLGAIGLICALILARPAAARGAVKIDPGYEAGEMGLELDLGYRPLTGEITLDGHWAVSEWCGFGGSAVIDQYGLTFGELGLTAMVRETWLEAAAQYGLDPLLGEYTSYLLRGEQIIGERFIMDVAGEVAYVTSAHIMPYWAISGAYAVGWRTENAMLLVGMQQYSYFDADVEPYFSSTWFIYFNSAKTYDNLTLESSLFANKEGYQGDLGLAYRLSDYMQIAGSVGASIAPEGTAETNCQVGLELYL